MSPHTLGRPQSRSFSDLSGVFNLPFFLAFPISFSLVLSPIKSFRNRGVSPSRLSSWYYLVVFWGSSKGILQNGGHWAGFSRNKCAGLGVRNLKFLRLTSVDFCKALLILWKPQFCCLKSKRAGFGNHSLPSGCILQSLSAVDASLLGALPSPSHRTLPEPTT